jgi:hypothetical protein
MTGILFLRKRKDFAGVGRYHGVFKTLDEILDHVDEDVVGAPIFKISWMKCKMTNLQTGAIWEDGQSRAGRDVCLYGQRNRV